MSEIDRLLFGDNQFFGVNHMSEEKARAQQMRFQSISAIQDVLDIAYDEGIHTFMCTTHDRIEQIASHVRANPDRYPDFKFFPGMPYAHKYANAVTEDGMIGAVRKFLPDDGFFDSAMRGGSSLAKKDIEGIITLLVDAEMKMFQGLSTPVIWLQNVVVDLLLGLHFTEALRIFHDHVRAKYGAEPGFITMNAPLLATRLHEVGIERPVICANFNKVGFRVSGGLEAYQRHVASRRRAVRRHVRPRLRRHPGEGSHRVGLPAARGRVHRLRCLQSRQHPGDSGARRRVLARLAAGARKGPARFSASR